jgi:23S rRNA (pseudouridine1915-N3)-methyltransferase
MKVRIVAAGTRLPAWMNAGYQEYSRRMPPESPLTLHEVEVQRTGGGVERAVKAEGERMLALVPAGTFVVALDVLGRPLDTPALAQWWARRLQDGRDLAFLIGGPEGLAPACVARADERISLSKLTLPHGLARVVLAEALYRAVTLLKGHPYHRA